MKSELKHKDGYILQYNLSKEDLEKIVIYLLEYYSKNSYFGEGIMQDDDSLIEAPNVLANIADDIFKFEEVDY